MAEELDMPVGVGKISDWVSRVLNARTDLIKCKSSQAADSANIGPMITKFMDLEPTVPGAMLWQIRACKWQKEQKADKQAFTWMLLKQSILKTADVSEAKKRKTQLMPKTPETTRRPKLSLGLPAGVGMVASQQEWNPDKVYEFAFAAA
eukprot:2030045-Rhodomonas_salina.2